MEQPPKSVDKDSVEIHSEAVPGIKKESIETDSSAVNVEMKKKEEAAGQIEMTPLAYDKHHNIVDVKTGNYIIKTFRTDNEGREIMVRNDKFKEGENEVFYEKGYFYKVYDEKENLIGKTSFIMDELKKLNENPQSPETQKMVMEKALRAQVDAIDNQANLEKKGE